mgnify:CR=1 FL=1
MFKKIAPDKWKHFYVGIVMGAVLEVAALLVFPGQLQQASLAAVLLLHRGERRRAGAEFRGAAAGSFSAQRQVHQSEHREGF